jgi:Ca-activated chloride channel family protein
MTVRLAALGLAATTGLVGLAGLPSLSDAKHLLDLHPPAWVERWLHNPRERTAAGLGHLEAGDRGAAAADFESARRLAPDDPRVGYNTGTARLLAGHGDAVAPLEQAARHAPSDLAATARYNLGNAQLAAGAPAKAVEAYEQALRLDPANAAAKFNLEVALRRLAAQRAKARKPQEAPGGAKSGKREAGEQGGGEDADRQPSPQTRRPGAREPRPRTGAKPGEDRPRPDGRSPLARRTLPNFRNQPDMTASQAAALLEAVENLERRERQAEAAARADKKAGEDDW